MGSTCPTVDVHCVWREVWKCRMLLGSWNEIHTVIIMCILTSHNHSVGAQVVGFVKMGHHYFDILNQQVSDPTTCSEWAKSAPEEGKENKQTITK